MKQIHYKYGKVLTKSISPSFCRNIEYIRGRNAPSEFCSRASSRLLLAIGDDAQVERNVSLTSE
jgi:hypothetical protein